jgi:CDP-diacylglycerol--glycerol-3-phosphate 3-phosphatidyltransferase
LATIYDLKPRFQALLRPIAVGLAHAGISANAVTIAALLLSLAQGAWLAVFPGSPWPLLVLPVTLFVRMALNAIDGIMAKEHGQASAQGAVLNEVSDVVADAALYLPFAYIPGFTSIDASFVVVVVVMSVIAEMTGALGPMLGTKRCYDGPFGKSDRALGFGLLAVLLGAGLAPGAWTTVYLQVLFALAVLTVINRARRIVAEAKDKTP